MAVLTDEQQSFVGTVRRTSMPTHGAGLTAVMSIYLDGHTLLQEGFIGNHAMQLCKAPFRIGGISLSLLHTRLFPLLAFGSFSNMSQIFQADQTLWVLFYDVFRDDVIGVLRSPVSLVH
jgi:hypothetical protein